MAESTIGMNDDRTPDAPAYHGTGVRTDADVVKITHDRPPATPPYHGNRGDQMPPSGDDSEIEHDEGGDEG